MLSRLLPLALLAAAACGGEDSGSGTLVSDSLGLKFGCEACRELPCALANEDYECFIEMDRACTACLAEDPDAWCGMVKRAQIAHLAVTWCNPDNLTDSCAYVSDTPPGIGSDIIDPVCK